MQGKKEQKALSVASGALRMAFELSHTAVISQKMPHFQSSYWQILSVLKVKRKYQLKNSTNIFKGIFLREGKIQPSP